MYISPLGTTFTARRVYIFEILEHNIAQYSKSGNRLICGYFNARTFNDPDFILEDKSLVTDNIPDYISDAVLVWNNMDTHSVDNHGPELLSLCKAFNVQILNGRSLGDYCAYCTCYSYAGHIINDYIMLTSIKYMSKI